MLTKITENVNHDGLKTRLLAVQAYALFEDLSWV